MASKAEKVERLVERLVTHGLASAAEERCVLRGYGGDPCGTQASHKVEEVLDAFEKPGAVVRHPLTAYVCCWHFVALMGEAAHEACGCPRE